MKISEIEAIAGKSEVYEMNPGAKYLVIVEDLASPQRCHEYQHWLRAQGLDCIVVPIHCKLFEIESKTRE